MVLVADPAVVAFERLSLPLSSWSVTVDNGLMTVVRCVAETVVGTVDDELGRGFVVGTLGVMCDV